MLKFRSNLKSRSSAADEVGAVMGDAQVDKGAFPGVHGLLSWYLSCRVGRLAFVVGAWEENSSFFFRGNNLTYLPRGNNNHPIPMDCSFCV